MSFERPYLDHTTSSTESYSKLCLLQINVMVTLAI